MRTLHELRQHVRDLAHAFHVEVTEHPFNGGEQMRLAVADTVGRRIFIPDLQNRRCYAFALHELGHILHPGGSYSSVKQQMYARIDVVKHDHINVDALREHTDLELRISRLRLEEEMNAWEWAVKNALEWDEDMTREKKWALKSYYHGRSQWERRMEIIQPLLGLTRPTAEEGRRIVEELDDLERRDRLFQEEYMRGVGI